MTTRAHTTPAKWNRVLAGAALAYLAYAGVFIANTSVVARTGRTFCLSDDAMVSMRYARNVAAGRGFVWNPAGLPVEGFSNPLWVLTMASLHRTGLPARLMSLPVQILGAILVVASLLLCASWVRGLPGTPSGLPAVTALSFGLYLPVNTWALLGSETAFLGFLFLFLFDRLGRAPDRFWTAPAVAAAAFLTIWTRLDAAVPITGLLVWLAADRGVPRRGRLWIWLSSASLIAILSVLAWSLVTFGRPLPIPFDLKLLGVPWLARLVRGTAVSGLWMLRVSPLLLLALPLARRTLPAEYRPAVAILASLTAYNVYVGGDAWERDVATNRFLTPALGPLFCLAAAGAMNLVAGLSGRSVFLRTGTAFVSVVAVNLLLNGALGLDSLSRWTLRLAPSDLEYSQKNIERAAALERLTDPKALIGVGMAGALPYFLDREFLDLLGKCDPIVARGPSHPMTGPLGLPWFVPGHSKWNAAYSIDEQKPDVVVTFAGPRDDWVRYADRDYVVHTVDGQPFAFRKGSPHVRWNFVTQ